MPYLTLWYVFFGSSPRSGNCILQVWNYGSTFQPCRCPLCRREITLLIPSDGSSLQRHNSDVAEILGKIERYNRYFGARSNGIIQVNFDAHMTLPWASQPANKSLNLI